jgi:hypothetical protein
MIGDANMLILSRCNPHKYIHICWGYDRGGIFKVTRGLFSRLYVCRLARPLRPNLRDPDGEGGFRNPTPLPKNTTPINFYTFLYYSNFSFHYYCGIILNGNFIDVHEISYNKSRILYIVWLPNKR